jgi:hypothetical protein
MARKKILDELHCGHCGRKLSKARALYETAWSGLYWCGKQKCAYEIMQSECEELSCDDPCNWDTDQ